MQRGSGLASWERFASELRPILLAYEQRHGRIPGRRTLAHLGHQRLVSAAYRYYGGYAAALRQLGLRSSPPARARGARPRPRSVRPTPRRPRWRYWTREEVQSATLARHYVEWVSLGLFPPSTVVARRHAGLAMHWLRRPGGWPAAARRHGLTSSHEGRAQLLKYRAVLRVLSCMEQRGRWPFAREDRSARHWRRRRTWEEFVTEPSFTPELCVLLWRRLLLHRSRMTDAHPALAPSANRRLTSFVRSFHARYPFHRLE